MALLIRPEYAGKLCQAMIQINQQTKNSSMNSKKVDMSDIMIS